MRIHAMACALAMLSCVEAGPEEGREPPQLLVLQMERREIPVQLDKPFTVVIGGNEVKMKLIARPHRLFEAGGVRFKYPRRFTFEYEKDEDVTTWAFEGPSTTLMLMRFEKEDPKALLKRMEDEFAQIGPNTKRSDTKLAVGKRVFAGRRLDLRVAGESLRQDLFAFNAGGATYLLMVQDSLTDDGKQTAETRAALELLGKTLELK